MDREELLNILAGLVKRNKITEREAAEILIKFDEGTLEPGDLPLSDPDALIPLTVAIMLAALSRRYILIMILPIEGRLKQRNPIVEEYYREAARIAKLYHLSPKRFHREAMSAVQSALSRLVGVGAGVSLSSEETARILSMRQAQRLDQIEKIMRRQERITNELIDRLNQDLLTQSAYLKRFASEMSARKLSGRPMSEDQVRRRLESYAGFAGHHFHRMLERGIEEGWVVDYVSMDDPFVCSPCLAAERAGPYLPGRGIFPMQVCLGMDRCRCERIPRYDPGTYEELIGRNGAFTG